MLKLPQIGPFKNRLLENLPPEVVLRLKLRPVQLSLNHDLETPGQEIKDLVFVEEGFASMTVAFAEGIEVETSMFGFESVIGASALMGVKHSLNRVFMQLAGHGFACTVASAQSEFQRCGPFHDLCLRYVQAQLTQSAQNTACNATHTYDQRLAKWLLICAERSQRDTMELAQEFVSEMLGSTRSTISIAASRLKAKGIIDYRRGSIVLLDKEHLEKISCECFRVVHGYLRSNSEFDTDFVA